MNDIVRDVFGKGTELLPYQMALRALIMYLIAIVLVRISGRRSFGMKSPFDNTITFLLGAVLARGVVGASPFFSTVVAGLVMVLLHRLFAWIGLKHHGFGKLIKGDSLVLYEKGSVNRENLNKSLISEKDLEEAVRLMANKASLEEVETAHLERNGEISMVKKSGAE